MDGETFGQKLREMETETKKHRQKQTERVEIELERWERDKEKNREGREFQFQHGIANKTFLFSLCLTLKCTVRRRRRGCPLSPKVVLTKVSLSGTPD